MVVPGNGRRFSTVGQNMDHNLCLHSEKMGDPDDTVNVNGAGDFIRSEGFFIKFQIQKD
jgi:hypothetical protein